MNLKIEYQQDFNEAIITNEDDKLIATVHGLDGDPRPLAALFAAAVNDLPRLIEELDQTLTMSPSIGDAFRIIDNIKVIFILQPPPTKTEGVS